GEALGQIKALGEKAGKEREEAREREASRFAFVEQKLRVVEAERDELRHELNVLQAAAAANGEGVTSGEHLAPLMSELGDMRRQLSETQNQLAEAREQLTASIEQSAATPQPASELPPVLMAELAEMRRQLSQTQTQL